MNSFKRRFFLKKLLFTCLAIGSFTPKSYALARIDNKYIHSTSPLETEMLKAYINWTKKFNQAPEEFLSSLNKIPMSDTSISSRSVEEFKNGSTLEFNGIILAKTEAAIILDSYFN